MLAGRDGDPALIGRYRKRQLSRRAVGDIARQKRVTIPDIRWISRGLAVGNVADRAEEADLRSDPLASKPVGVEMDGSEVFVHYEDDNALVRTEGSSHLGPHSTGAGS